MIKHVSFDVWNTLIISNPKFKTFRANYIFEFVKKTYGYPLVDERYVREVFTGVSKKFDTISINSQQAVGADFMLAFAINELGLGYATNELISTMHTDIEEIFLNTLPILTDKEGIVSLFDSLINRGIRISILSNTGFISGKTMREALDMLGLTKYFSFYIFSDELGFSKPSEKAFSKLYEKAMVSSPVELPSDILHVGDSLICDGACETYEMKFHLYEKKHGEFTHLNTII